jgi:cytochrome c heme-lyase
VSGYLGKVLLMARCRGEFAQLAKFQGKPGELSPKARMALWAGKVLPSQFKFVYRPTEETQLIAKSTIPPFDRHDWVVTRPDLPASTTPTPAPTTAPNMENVKTTSTRYVIDYYSAPPDEDGNPVFSLDVRPALDSLSDINLRVRVGVEEWMRGDKT